MLPTAAQTVRSLTAKRLAAAGTIAFICSPLSRLTATCFEIWAQSICLLRFWLTDRGSATSRANRFSNSVLMRHFCQLVRNWALASSRLGARPLLMMPSLGLT